jgi:hypothetical protein
MASDECGQWIIAYEKVKGGTGKRRYSGQNFIEREDAFNSSEAHG